MKKLLLSFKTLVTVLFLMFFVSAAFGQKTWTGATSTDWADGTNWSPAGVPSNTSVSIPGSIASTRYPVVSSSVAAVTTISINSSGAGATLTINAGGSLTATGLITVNANGTFTMNAGTATLAGITTSNAVNVAGGTMTSTGAITINSGATLTQTGGTIHLATNTSTTPTDNLVINAGGNYNQSAGSIAIKDYTAVTGSPGGTFTQSATGLFKMDHDFRNAGVFTSTGGTIEFAGSGGGNAFNSPGTNQFFNVTINSGVSTDFASNLAASILVRGNWTNNGTALLIGTATTVTFNGSAAQSIGGTSSTTFRNIIFNNSSGGISLAAPATVSTGTTFTSGIVTTGTTNLLTFNAGATTSVSSNTSFVNGPVRKIFNAAEAFTFPVGVTGTGDEPLGISGAAAGNDFTAQYVRSSARALGGVTSPVLNVSACDYWTLTKNSAPAASVSVTLSWDASSPCNGNPFVTGPASLTVAHFTGPNWVQAGTSGSFTGTNTAGTVTRNAVTAFSPFALGNTAAGQNPLPVKFGEVKLFEKNAGVQIDWSTYSEVNVKHFEVQRSSDGITFTTIGSLNARNLNQRSEYSWFDGSPLVSNNFYRIKAVDIDGRSDQTAIVKINLKKTVKGFSIFPNPASGKQLSFQSSALDKGEYVLMIYNNTGQQLYRKNLTHAGGAFSQSVLLPGSLQSGMYNIQLLNNETRIIKPFIVQ